MADTAVLRGQARAAERVEHERILATRNGRSSTVLVSPDDLGAPGKALDLSEPALAHWRAFALGHHLCGPHRIDSAKT